MQRDLLSGASHLGTEVPPMRRDQLLARDQAEPEKWRQARVGGVRGSAAEDFNLSILKHVGRVHATLEPAVEAEADHSTQLFAVACE
jgi:hypothetical protein